MDFFYYSEISHKGTRIAVIANFDCLHLNSGRLAKVFIKFLAKICFAKTVKEREGRESSCVSVFTGLFSFRFALLAPLLVSTGYLHLLLLINQTETFIQLKQHCH